MAGRGPAPKPEDSRARGKRSDPTVLRVIHADPVPQPDLPAFDVAVTVDGEIISQRFEWPERTREWWAMWADSPLSADFTATDWSELLDTAVIHAKFWTGDTKLAPELRLRAAKFGATPEDRARLRITFAQAEEAEQPKKQGATSGRYKGLRSLGGGEASA